MAYLLLCLGPNCLYRPMSWDDGMCKETLTACNVCSMTVCLCRSPLSDGVYSLFPVIGRWPIGPIGQIYTKSIQTTVWPTRCPIAATAISEARAIFYASWELQHCIDRVPVLGCRAYTDNLNVSSGLLKYSNRRRWATATSFKLRQFSN